MDRTEFEILVVGTGPVEPHVHPGAVVGVYVNDLLKLSALVVMDMPAPRPQQRTAGPQPSWPRRSTTWNR